MVTVTPNSRVPRNLIISITKPLKICVRIGVFSGMVNLHSKVNHFFKFIVLAHNSLVYLHGRFQATFSQVYVEEHICIFVTLKASCTSTKPPSFSCTSKYLGVDMVSTEDRLLKSCLLLLYNTLLAYQRPN